jgi:hypothetical protein
LISESAFHKITKTADVVAKIADCFEGQSLSIVSFAFQSFHSSLQFPFSPPRPKQSRLRMAGRYRFPLVIGQIKNLSLLSSACSRLSFDHKPSGDGTTKRPE